MSIQLPGRALRRASYLQFRPCIAIPGRRWTSSLNDTRLKSWQATGDDPVNPPLTSLPPPFDSPARDPSHGTARHLFRVGKAYLVFYKEGVKRVWANRKSLNSKLESLPADDRPSVFRPSHVPKAFTRADWVFFWRVQHDVSRLPIFALVLLVFDELTVLIAYYIDGIMPYTCRLPKQIQKTRRKAEERRKDAQQHLEWKYPDGVTSVTAPVARTHVLQSLHLISTLWDKVGFVLPGLWALKGRPRIAYLEADDQLLRQPGIDSLSEEELVIACGERGISVLAEGSEACRSSDDMRASLQKWLDLTDAPEMAERRKRMATLLMTKPGNWPETRKFPLPQWSL